MIAAAGRLAWRALCRFLDHHGPDRAAAVAYYTLLSLLPLFIFLISLGAALLGSFDAAYRGTLFFFRGVVVHLDAASLEALRAFIERAVRFQWPGLLLLAWTAKRIFASLFSALETVFETPSRGFAQGNLLALAMVMVTGLAVLATLAFSTSLAAAEGLLLRVAEAAGVEGLNSLTAQLLTHLLPVLITVAFFFVLYRVAPRRPVPSALAAVGALVAAFLWEVAKAGFAYYVRNLAHYAGVYGTLEGVIVLALWLELSVSIILYGGEVVALLLPAKTGLLPGFAMPGFAIDTGRDRGVASAHPTAATGPVRVGMASTRLFVGNIPYATTEQELRDTFTRAGGVASVRIITDFDTGRSKGYAFVEMATPEEAEKAIRDFNNFNLNGRTIVVNEARPRAAGGRRDQER